MSNFALLIVSTVILVPKTSDIFCGVKVGSLANFSFKLAFSLILAFKSPLYLVANGCNSVF